MRKISLAVIGSFAAVVLATSVSGGGTFEVGGNGQVANLTIVKEVNGDTTGLDPWEFSIVSENCGPTIAGPGGGVSSLTVTIPAGGGSTSVMAQRFVTAIGVPESCTYGVSETPVDGWDTERGTFGGVSVPGTVTFVNTADTTSSSSSSSSSSSTTSTSVASEPTATVDDSATTVVATTAQPQLPATGSDSNTQLALVAGSVLLAGIAATMASRRRPAS